MICLNKKVMMRHSGYIPVLKGREQTLRIVPVLRIVPSTETDADQGMLHNNAVHQG